MDARALIARMKWPDGKPICPACGSDRVSLIVRRKTYQCNVSGCRKQFTAKTGTVAASSILGCELWVRAMRRVSETHGGISSCQLAIELGVTQKTAWHMLARIRPIVGTDEFRELVNSQ